MAEERQKSYEDYIRKYASEAMRQQKKYGVPSSITLAQGLLESNAGNSTLSKKSNNHFGIKCNGKWSGATFQYFDDGEMCCFRKYKTVLDSYIDHSLYLKTSSRYDELFTLRVTDYKRWARGLKAAGYATDRQYAEKLINLIELYNLDEYDRIAKRGGAAMGRFDDRQILYAGNTPYIIAGENDTYLRVACEFEMTTIRLKHLNDFERGHKLQPGERIFIKRKSRKWKGDNAVHKVRSEETLHYISQEYGIRLKSLIKLNETALSRGLMEGDTIRLR